MSPCICLQVPAAYQLQSSPSFSNGIPPPAKPARGKCTTAVTLLDMIKDVEIAINSRKGRTGTAAGDVAFPKGKENLASVLKRYKRRLSNKTVGTHEGPGSGMSLTSTPYGHSLASNQMGYIIVVSAPVILFILIVALAFYLLGRATGRRQSSTAPQYFGPTVPPPQEKFAEV